MGESKNIPDFIDKRLEERLMDRGELTESSMGKYLKGLPDLADEAEFVNLGGETTEEEEGGETA
jgi:hypothetical protein